MRADVTVFCSIMSLRVNNIPPPTSVDFPNSSARLQLLGDCVINVMAPPTPPAVKCVPVLGIAFLLDKLGCGGVLLRFALCNRVVGYFK